MDRINHIKKLFDFIKTTPFHPQWFAFKDQKANLFNIVHLLEGKILDIGCGQKLIEQYMPSGCRYIALDYFKTSVEWYGSNPDVYGDAQSLPFADESTDGVLLLDVMEHLPQPDNCLGEIERVLVKGGVLIIAVPFLYPIHDAPLDFRRWTLYGLREIIKKHGFIIKNEKHHGNLLESSGLLMNIAMSKTVLNWIHQKNPLALLIVFLPFVVLLINSLSFLLTYFSPEDKMMPSGYQLVIEKL